MKGVMRLLLHEIYGGSRKKKTETTYNPWQYYRNPSLSGSSNSSYKPYNPFTNSKGKKEDKKQDKPLSLVEQYIREENTPQNAKLLKSDSANSDAAKKSVLTIQQGLNLAGVKDKNGNLLKEDGKFGSKTQNNLNQFWKERFPNEPNYLGGIVQTNTTGLPYPAISNYYTTPTAKSWNFSSYPVTASHPKQEFDVTDGISIYKKELRAAKKRKEEDDARREADEQRKNANAKLPSNAAVSGSYASGYTHTLTNRNPQYPSQFINPKPRVIASPDSGVSTPTKTTGKPEKTLAGKPTTSTTTLINFPTNYQSAPYSGFDTVSTSSSFPTNYQSMPSSGFMTYPTTSGSLDSGYETIASTQEEPLSLEDMDIGQVKKEYKKAQEQYRQKLEEQAKTVIQSHNGNHYVEYGGSKFYVDDDIVQQLTEPSKPYVPVVKQSTTGNNYVEHDGSKFYVDDEVVEHLSKMEINNALASGSLLTEKQVDNLTPEQLSDPAINELARNSIVKVIQDDAQQEVWGYPNGAEPLSYEQRMELNYKLWEIAEHNPEKTYMDKTLSHIALDNWSEDKTLLGALGLGAMSLLGLDAINDVSNLAHNFTHWQWTGNHIGETLFNTVALIPTIGIVDDVWDGAKTAGKVADAVEAAGKTSDAAKVVGKADEVIEGVIDSAIDSSDEFADVAKNSEATESVIDQTFGSGGGVIVIRKGNLEDLPDNALEMFGNYDKAGWKGTIPGQTPGTAAGSKYLNKDGKLPTIDSAGNPMTYKEFDVNNKLPNANRDAQRFLKGSDGSIYYTEDHYSTFIKVK